jgi:hypothetical protein
MVEIDGLSEKSFKQSSEMSEFLINSDNNNNARKRFVKIDYFFAEKVRFDCETGKKSTSQIMRNSMPDSPKMISNSKSIKHVKCFRSKTTSPDRLKLTVVSAMTQES